MIPGISFLQAQNPQAIPKTFLVRKTRYFQNEGLSHALPYRIDRTLRDQQRGLG
jgi:hypothetical protein